MSCLVARTAHLVTPRLRPRSRISPMGLTVREEGTEWRYGASIHNLLLAGFPRRIPLLQKARRACDGAMPGRGAVHSARYRIQFDRHHRETHGGKHALAVDRFSHHRRREARQKPRHGVWTTAKNTHGIDGNVGARLETRSRRACPFER